MDSEANAASFIPDLGTSNPRNYEASPIWEGAKSPLPTIAIFFFFFEKFSFFLPQLHGQSLVITARIFNETRCPLPLSF